ncbi:MAG: iron-sulfur cluster assembly scaffold protein [Anaerovoracaceae bacterium]
METKQAVIKKVIEEGKCSCGQAEAMAEGACTDPDCGDELSVYFKTERELVSGIGFSITPTACDVAKACGYAVINLAKDKPVMEAYLIGHKEVAAYLGGLAEENLHCAMMAELALKRAIVQYSNAKKEKLKKELER